MSLCPYPSLSLIPPLWALLYTHIHPSLVRKCLESPLLWAVVWLTRPVSFIEKETSSVSFWSSEIANLGGEGSGDVTIRREGESWREKGKKRT